VPATQGLANVIGSTQVARMSTWMKSTPLGVDISEVSCPMTAPGQDLANVTVPAGGLSVVLSSGGVSVLVSVS
jgi:hypothetical protein